MVISCSVGEVGTVEVLFIVVLELRDRHDGRRWRVGVVPRDPFAAAPEVLEFTEQLQCIHLLEPLLLEKMLVSESPILDECLLSELLRFHVVLRHLGEGLGIFRIQQVQAVLVYDLRVILADVEQLCFLHGQKLVEGDLCVHYVSEINENEI